MNLTRKQNLVRLAKELETAYQEVRKDARERGLTSPDEEARAILAAPLCRFVKLLVPDAHQKIDEIVFAAEHPELAVSSHQHGADLSNAKGENFELKVSICKGKAQHCNFNWPIPTGANESERRKKLLASVKSKVTGAGGKAVFLVKNGIGDEISRFELSAGFLLAYFGRVKIGSCDKHNFGCARCKVCKKFHRMEKIQEASVQYDKDPNSVTWNEVFEVTQSQC